MKKVYLMKGLTVMAMGLAVASCSKMEFDGQQKVSDEEAKANAELALGITFDENQDWNMTQQATAKVSVNGNYGETYKVFIYENNPFVDHTGVLLGKSSVVSGQSTEIALTMPKSLGGVYVTIQDQKGYNYVKPAGVVNGEISATFGAESTSRRAATRGAVEDNTIPSITKPTAAEMAAAYLDGATEVNAENAEDNYDNTENLGYTDPTFILKMKISQTWNGSITVVATEGYDWAYDASIPPYGATVPTTKKNPYCARTVYVNGTWNLTEDQRVGSGGVIVVAEGGTINISESKQLQLVNQARLIVLPGGQITGKGSIEISNGTGANDWGYNGGTINIGTFRNNFGEFYNYGTMILEQMLGPGGGSKYINHGKVNITAADKGSGTASLRLLNNCWFECAGTFACRNIIQGEGAYIKTKNLEMSCGNDGTSTPASIFANHNSLIDVTGAAAFNNVDIIGPESGDYAYLQLGYVEDANQAHSLTTSTNYTGGWNGQAVTCGAIQNNIRLSVDNPGSYKAPEFIGLLNGQLSTWNSWASSTVVGNGHAELVEKGAYDIATIDPSECSPGITPNDKTTPIVETYPIYSYAFEDTKLGDYDMNDVVLKVQETADSKINLSLVAAGATLDLNIRLYTYDANNASGNYYGSTYQLLSYQNQTEIHDMLGVDKGTMVNTGAGATATPITIQIDKNSYDPSKLRLAIYSESQGEIRLAGSGQSPYGVIIPADWKWPVERVNITRAYNQSNATAEGEDNKDQRFSTFASQFGAAEKWYNYPTGNVMQ